MMTVARIVELRGLSASDTPVTLPATELAWLFETQDQTKLALRGLFETHVAIDPPARGPCQECLAAIIALARIEDASG
jgi:hypothetical protein